METHNNSTMSKITYNDIKEAFLAKELDTRLPPLEGLS